MGTRMQIHENNVILGQTCKLIFHGQNRVFSPFLLMKIQWVGEFIQASKFLDFPQTTTRITTTTTNKTEELGHPGSLSLGPNAGC